MPKVAKECANDNFQNPTPTPASLRALRQRLMIGFPGTIPIGTVDENLVYTLLHANLDRV